jgi:hypothetical protein
MAILIVLYMLYLYYVFDIRWSIYPPDTPSEARPYLIGRRRGIRISEHREAVTEFTHGKGTFKEPRISADARGEC